jgi:transcription termination factor Rho
MNIINTNISLSITDLETRNPEDLRDIARDWDLAGYTTLTREELIFQLLQTAADRQGPAFSAGVLEVTNEGLGYLRRRGGRPSPMDVYVSATQIRRFGLRTGDMVSGQARPPKENERFYGLLRVDAVNGMDPEAAKRRPSFDALTPIFPNSMFDLETDSANIIGRLINLIAPIGRGQRGLIVAPPKAGKTLMLKSIANSIAEKYPDINLMMALIGERPEEVTEMRRGVRAEIFSSTFDEPADAHTHVAELALERAKRLVEAGKDVVMLLDSITRLTRAYNLAISPSGRTLSGGLDPSAINPPKRFIGAARNLEEGGSLTIIATVLVDTNSRMDDVIYEEFKGTGNMEITLDRKLSERRIFPAIDITRSSTRREELLLSQRALDSVLVVRRMFAALDSGEAIETTDRLFQMLARTQNNEEFVTALRKGMGN